MALGNFKLEKPALHFTDLDIPYQNHFIKEFIYTGSLMYIRYRYAFSQKQGYGKYAVVGTDPDIIHQVLSCPVIELGTVEVEDSRL